MANEKNLVWLASYPKSGNIWLRAFLANYLLTPSGPFPLNDLPRLVNEDSALSAYQQLTALDPNMMDLAARLKLRPVYLGKIAENGADVNLVKTHHANTQIMGVDLVPAGLTRASVYLIRNPLDLVLSYGEYLGMPADEIADLMSRETNALPGSHRLIPQFLGNWSDHVRGWAGATEHNVMVLRYEDLLDDPAAGFTRVLDHLGFDLDQGHLDRAINYASFENLKKMEENTQFSERNLSGAPFFRSGQAGQWKDKLREDVVSRIRDDHAAVMEDYGYL